MYGGAAFMLASDEQGWAGSWVRRRKTAERTGVKAQDESQGQAWRGEVAVYVR